MSDLNEFLSVAKELALKAGDLCLELQNNLGDVRYKSVKDVVTIADVSSEKLIVEGLRAAFPTHSIRTEEAGIIEGSDPRYRWIIDPVDGTVNFSRGIPLREFLLRSILKANRWWRLLIYPNSVNSTRPQKAWAHS